MSITWEEPPPASRGRGAEPPYGLAALEDLRKNPGRWALLHAYSRRYTADSAAQAIRKGRTKDEVAGEFEATVRGFPDGTARLYARYIGGEK